ncbi:MAG: SsrA-binding protein SmpB [Crocinitomicaceae bacterium]
MGKIEIKNKKVKFEFEFLDDYSAGIVLTGTEIKSIRTGKGSIMEAYCIIHKKECFIRNMFIPEYENGSYSNHNPRRDRKLLLNRQEINKLEKKLKDKGLTIVASKLFISSKNLAKINIHLARGKKLHDKREDLKTKDVKRDLDRVMKQYK